MTDDDKYEDPDYDLFDQLVETDTLALRDLARQLTAELKDARGVLLFADGVCVNSTGMCLADLYASDYAPAQVALAKAGCWPRGSFRSGAS